MKRSVLSEFDHLGQEHAGHVQMRVSGVLINLPSGRVSSGVPGDAQRVGTIRRVAPGVVALDRPITSNANIDLSGLPFAN